VVSASGLWRRNYERYGFQELQHRLVSLPDAITMDSVEMEKAIG